MSTAEQRQSRFEKYLVRGPGCWTWTGARMRTGYGSFRWASYVRELAHRAAWRIYVGPIPTGMQVCHHCDNPPCVRLDHLFLGTNADNLQDMARKGRHYSRTAPEKVRRGANHPGTKLSAADVVVIRRELASGATKSELARQFHVSRTLIRVVNRHHWSDR